MWLPNIIVSVNITEFRGHFLKDEKYIHLNNAGQAPIPDLYMQKATEWLERMALEGAFMGPQGRLEVEVTRNRLAQLIGAKPEEIAFFQTAASALSQAAMGIPLKADDEIITWDQEYPSNYYPWLRAAERAQAKLVIVESKNWMTPYQAILNAVTPRTRIIAVSWVQYLTGAVTDLPSLAEELSRQDIWLVADVIQGVGVRPFDFRKSKFDIVCGAGHKWLCSGFSAGYMAIREDRMDQLDPIQYGAITYGTPDTPKGASGAFRPTAQRYEPGTKSFLDLIAMGASLELLQSKGLSSIYREATRLAERLRVALKEMGFQLFCSGGPIVNFAPTQAHELNTIISQLTEHHIGFAARGPGIRLSPHAFNTDEDIDQVLRVLARLQ